MYKHFAFVLLSLCYTLNSFASRTTEPTVLASGALTPPLTVWTNEMKARVNELERDVLLYPSPISNKLHIYNLQLFSGKSTVTILGLDGKEKYRNEFLVTPDVVKVDTKTWRSGVYKVIVHYEGLGTLARLIEL